MPFVAFDIVSMAFDSDQFQTDLAQPPAQPLVQPLVLSHFLARSESLFELNPFTQTNELFKLSDLVSDPHC